MTGFAGLIILGGYSVFTFGWSQLHGCNAGFVDLVWPGRYKGCKPDKAPAKSSGSSSASSGGLNILPFIGGPAGAGIAAGAGA